MITNKNKLLYLPNQIDTISQLTIFLCESLICHISCCPGSAYKYFIMDGLKGNILHIWSYPAVGLTIHGLWSQSGSYQEYRLVGKFTETDMYQTTTCFAKTFRFFILVNNKGNNTCLLDESYPRALGYGFTAFIFINVYSCGPTFCNRTR